MKFKYLEDLKALKAMEIIQKWRKANSVNIVVREKQLKRQHTKRNLLRSRCAPKSGKRKSNSGEI